MNVKLISHSVPTGPKIEGMQGLVAFCARVSNPSNQHNQSTEKLITYLLDNKHFSPLEMVNVCLEIETTRDIGRQILRHRSFTFQEFCVTGDSLITTVTKGGRTKKVSIEKLYARHKSDQYRGISDNLVRVYDEKSRFLSSAKIKEVFKTGKKDVYELTLENGKKIQSTMDHKFLTYAGFKPLKAITIDSFVGCNGIPVHQEHSWLQQAKIESIEAGVGIPYIAHKAQISYHTVRKWLRIHKLQYSKKEVATYTSIWNKGIPKEYQPNFGGFHSKETREKMSASAMKGVDSNLYKNGKYTTDTMRWRNLVAQKCKGYHSEILQKQNNRCAISGARINLSNSEVDHIHPVYSHPSLAFEKTNLQVLCKEAHRVKSGKERKEAKYTARFSKVKSIFYIGEKETYDIEVEHHSHNYIANGIVTHNSQRYADPVKELNFELREARLQDAKNRQNSMDTTDRDLKEYWHMKQMEVINLAKKNYQWALYNGLAKECARVVLPEGNTLSRMYVNGTMRSWLHYCDLRGSNGTQKEHMDIARECVEVISTVFPLIKQKESPT
jgi:thymidylate synthase (FAD)